jgi:hypothetical protein
MTTKRRLFLIASLPLAIAFLFGVLAMLPEGPGVTKANFDKVEKGMTLAEVEQIFGKAGLPKPIDEFLEVVWQDNKKGNEAIVTFEDGRVDSMFWHSSDGFFFRKLLRWLRLN